MFTLKRNLLVSTVPSLLHLPAFHNMTGIINHSYGTVLELLVGVLFSGGANTNTFTF